MVYGLWTSQGRYSWAVYHRAVENDGWVESCHLTTARWMDYGQLMGVINNINSAKKRVEVYWYEDQTGFVVELGYGARPDQFRVWLRVLPSHHTPWVHWGTPTQTPGYSWA